MTRTAGTTRGLGWHERHEHHEGGGYTDDTHDIDEKEARNDARAMDEKGGHDDFNGNTHRNADQDAALVRALAAYLGLEGYGWAEKQQ